MTNKKTMEEKIKEANHPNASKKLVQVWLWQSQNETLIKTAGILKERFGIVGNSGTAVAVACQLLLNQLEENDEHSKTV